MTTPPPKFRAKFDWVIVFRELERGKSLRDIARRFNISSQTITSHARDYKVLPPDQLQRFEELMSRNRAGARHTSRTTPIDWDLVFRQLRAGHMARDIARWTIGLTIHRVGIRAQRELPPERLAEYRRLARRNFQASREPAHGTYGALQKHWREKTTACEPCLAKGREIDARKRERERERREQRRQGSRDADT